jgi:hypothetical protein
MTLEELRHTIKNISLSHKEIRDFDYGEDFLLATGKGKDYPLVFLELPYSINYESDNRFKTLSFALNVLMTPTDDDIKDDHENISEAEQICDAIITRFQDEVKQFGFIINNVNGISLREYSDDNVSGFRLEIQGRVFRSYCNKNYQDEFN